MAYGFQLLLDLYGCKGCDDLELCYRFLDEIVAHLGVRKQAPPSIFRTDASLTPKHEGLTGWVPLIESSVVIHTHVPDKFISIDLYSCKPFNYVHAIGFCKQFFKPEKVHSQEVTRGVILWDITKNEIRPAENNTWMGIGRVT
jgi:S-adenosylmethionine decarboxylase